MLDPCLLEILNETLSLALSDSVNIKDWRTVSVLQEIQEKLEKLGGDPLLAEESLEKTLTQDLRSILGMFNNFEHSKILNWLDSKESALLESVKNLKTKRRKALNNVLSKLTREGVLNANTVKKGDPNPHQTVFYSFGLSTGKNSV